MRFINARLFLSRAGGRSDSVLPAPRSKVGILEVSSRVQLVSALVESKCQLSPPTSAGRSIPHRPSRRGNQIIRLSDLLQQNATIYWKRRMAVFESFSSWVKSHVMVVVIGATIVAAAAIIAVMAATGVFAPDYETPNMAMAEASSKEFEEKKAQSAAERDKAKEEEEEKAKAAEEEKAETEAENIEEAADAGSSSGGESDSSSGYSEPAYSEPSYSAPTYNAPTYTPPSYTPPADDGSGSESAPEPGA